MPEKTFRKILTTEAALFFGLLFAGFVLMPIAIYVIGHEVFGAYAGNGFGEFFGDLSRKIRSGEPVAWFFVLAPYLGWQVLRLTVFGFRRAGRSKA